MSLMTARYVCVFTETYYGVSGDELPPPVQSKIQYALLSLPEETLEQFKERMRVVGLDKRNLFENVTVSQYSQRPGLGWNIVKIVT